MGDLFKKIKPSAKERSKKIIKKNKIYGRFASGKLRNMERGSLLEITGTKFGKKGKKYLLEREKSSL